MKFIHIIIVFTIIINHKAVSQTYKRILHWNKPLPIESNLGTKSHVLNFSNALYTQNNIPYYKEVFNTSNKKAIIENEIYTDLNTDEIELINDTIKSKLITSNIYGIQKNENKLIFSVIPIRFNSVSNKYEKLLSFDIKLINHPSNTFSLSKLINTKSNKSSINSVLASGDWYKISINTDGIYKISYTFLKEIGIDIDNVNPKNIRIFGNGGKILPEPNEIQRHNDLVENRISIIGEDDESFDENDYILFYGKGTTYWEYDKIKKAYLHQNNLYSDISYYYINISTENGLRIQSSEPITEISKDTIYDYIDFLNYEEELYNHLKSGKEWYGNKFDTYNTFDTTFNTPNIDTSKNIYIYAEAISRSTEKCSFDFNIDSNKILSINALKLHTLSGYSLYATTARGSKLFKQKNTTKIDLNITYNQSTPTSVGWLNKVDINVTRKLIFEDNQLQFRKTDNIGLETVSTYIINSEKDITIWDISDPLFPISQNTERENNIVSFKHKSDTSNEFIAYFDNFLQPYFVEKIQNQNLHSLINNPVNLIIVTHPMFEEQANRLANLHENEGLSYIVVKTNHIFNEFSSGIEDPVAIRDFVKYMYDNQHPDSPLNYLLLFGDASYDYKNEPTNTSNLIPSYQSSNSLDPTKSHTTDDFFGYLDDNEGNWNYNNLIDISIGRLPVQTIDQANAVVNKIINYSANHKIQNNNTGTSYISNYDDWKNNITFIADDEDYDVFFTQSEDLSDIIFNNNKNLNINKIYIDSYIQESNSGGTSYPNVNKAIKNRINSGTLLVNYIGHGGEAGWAAEKILTIPDILSWNNKYNLPIFVTATCEFSRYDNHNKTSGGEYILLNQNGGGIALLTTTRLAFSDINFKLVTDFMESLINKLEAPGSRIGDTYLDVKTIAGSNYKYRNLSLLGDPAMIITNPEYLVRTNYINEKIIDSNEPLDTIKSYQKVNIKGSISDTIGNKISNFNGVIYPTVFDKSKTYYTQGNDNTSSKKPFNLQDNIIFKGKAQVINGDFEFTFITPKDISYDYGLGKISYYAEDGTYEANGYSSDFIIGGKDTTNSEALKDVTPPYINILIDDKIFDNRSFLTSNPLFVINISDSSGINTTGNGIGHDISLIIDENYANPIILNSYFEYDLDSYQNGTIKYQLNNLSPGQHTIRIKVWDINNNSNEFYSDFYVIEEQEFEVEKVFNYPNPFSSNTSFFFTHNKALTSFDVQIQIYTITGNLIKNIKSTTLSDQYTIKPIEWDGKDDFGENISKGIYFYRIKIRSEDGDLYESIEKLYIL